MSGRRRVVLVGAGHAHVLVLKRWSETPLDDTDVTIVTDRPDATYSGMVPGFLAGDYGLDDTRIAVLPLARAAGATLLVRSARRVDPQQRTIELEDGQKLAWDVASLDIGSTVQGLTIPGAREHAIATRPIDAFAEHIDSCLARLAGRHARLVIAGGGAAGIEIAFTLRARLAAAGCDFEILVACGRDGPLPTYPARARRLAEREAAAAGIRILRTTEVRRVDRDGIEAGDERIDADLVVLATGAAPPSLVADSPLPRDQHGFLRVRATLEVPGIRGLFAAGDCASIECAERTAKAGVHAVRAAPVLEANIRALLGGEDLQEFYPQREFLSLLNLGGRRALATKWGLAFCGHLAWILKDRIDRAFVRSFQIPAAAQRR